MFPEEAKVIEGDLFCVGQFTEEFWNAHDNPPSVVIAATIILGVPTRTVHNVDPVDVYAKRIREAKESNTILGEVSRLQEFKFRS